ncbi:MAG TPA: hypothetical protein VLF89_02665 [Candidatus Saccharimonadales bacterium]|nr:hypothetical protein [Candidatus Saccharimonadales bacterium]
MVSITVSLDTMTLPSLSAIRTNMKMPSVISDYSTRTAKKIINNKYIAAFTAILWGPV